MALIYVVWDGVDSKMLENFELDGSGIKEEDLYPLIQAIQVILILLLI